MLNASYRYYWDDWGVKAQTVDARYRFDFGARYIEPHVRYSVQTSAADFYRPFLQQGESPAFASADYRLAEMTTTTFGVKYGMPFKSGELSVRLEFVRQTGDDRPGNAPGQLANQDLFPDTEATLLQLSYSLLW